MQPAINENPCPVCKQENLVTSRFCHACGVRLVFETQPSDLVGDTHPKTDNPRPKGRTVRIFSVVAVTIAVITVSAVGWFYNQRSAGDSRLLSEVLQTGYFDHLAKAKLPALIKASCDEHFPEYEVRVDALYDDWQRDHFALIDWLDILVDAALRKASGGDASRFHSSLLALQKMEEARANDAEAAFEKDRAARKRQCDDFSSQVLSPFDPIKLSQFINEQRPTLFSEIMASAIEGATGAQMAVAYMLQNGIGTPIDTPKARQWMQKSATGGNLVAMTELAVMFEHGIGGAQDLDEARKVYLKAGEAGSRRALYLLGLLYKDGRGVEADGVMAFRYFQLSAYRGYSPAMVQLGNAYRRGNGVSTDPGLARIWYLKAADKNNSGAQYLLGTLFLAGTPGKPDYKEALKWFGKSAENNNPNGVYSMGYMFGQGFGVNKDEVQAVKWITRSAQMNHAISQLALGKRYREGRGVERNLAQSYFWIKLAEASGHKDAPNELRKLEEIITDAERLQGEHLLAERRVSKPVPLAPL